MDFQKIFKMHDRLYVGINGLPTDVQTMCGPHPREAARRTDCPRPKESPPPPALPTPRPRAPLP